MYSGHSRLCICLPVPLRISTLLHIKYTDPDVTWGNGRECPLVVHYSVDLQLVHGFHCYDNIHVCILIALYTANAYSAERECQRLLVLVLCLVSRGDQYRLITRKG